MMLVTFKQGRGPMTTGRRGSSARTRRQAELSILTSPQNTKPLIIQQLRFRINVRMSQIRQISLIFAYPNMKSKCYLAENQPCAKIHQC